MVGSPSASSERALSVDARKVVELARGWATEGDPNDDAFDGALLAEIIGVDRLDEAIEEAASVLNADLGTRSIQFLADLHSELMAGDFDFTLRDGREMTGEIRTFFVHLFGPESDIRDVVSSPLSVEKMATSLMEHGVAHPDSTVFLMPFVIPALSLLEVTPGATRRATTRIMEALASKLTTGHAGETLVEDLREILGGVYPSDLETDAEGRTLTSCFVYGMRFLPREVGDARPMDDYVRGFHSPDTVKDERTENADEGEAWGEAMAEAFPHLDMDAPNDWQGAVGDAAHAVISHCLCLETDLLGIARGAAARAAHIHSGDEHMHLAFVFDKGVVGPVCLPTQMAMVNVEVLLSHVKNACEELHEHERIEDFLKVLGTVH